MPPFCQVKQQPVGAQAELDFFDTVTEVSGRLYPVPRDQRRAAAVDFLRQLSVPRPDLYMPATPGARLLAIIPESGAPMQSAAKVSLRLAALSYSYTQQHRPVEAMKALFGVENILAQMS